MAKKPGMALGLAALGLYIVGGFGIFGGLALILLMKGRDLLHWGEGRSIGYLFLCIGICLSILGVLMMRIFRNRGLT